MDTPPASSKTGHYRFENTIGVKTGAMLMRGQWGGNVSGGKKQEDETRTALALKITIRYDDIMELSELEEQTKTMMTHLNRIGKAVSDQVDVILEQTCEPAEAMAPMETPTELATGEQITEGQLTYIMDLLAARGTHGPLNLTPAAFLDLTERRFKVRNTHLEKATKAHGKQVKDLDQLYKYEASTLIDALKEIKPKKKKGR